MNRYKVRTHKIGALGFFTQADHYRDYEIESAEPLNEFAARLAATGFMDDGGRRWIMPGAIIWIEQK